MEWTTEWFDEARRLILTGDQWWWLRALFAASVGTLVVKFGLRLLAGRLRRVTVLTASIWDDVGVDLIEGLKAGVLFTWLFSIFSRAMQLPEGAKKPILVAVVIVTVFQVALWGQHIIRKWHDSVLRRRIEQDMSSAAALGLFYAGVQVLFLTTILLIGLSNVGVDIGALLAGLGVGGIAVALAAQNILGDLLASLSIVLDKPFVVGDFIAVGNDMGTVEQIGIKTTRVKSLSGEQLIFSNKDLLESRVRNFKRMQERRAVQKFGVSYGTPRDVLHKIPSWVKELVDREEKLRFDHCHLMTYGGSSLDFELVYWVREPDMSLFMDLHQRLLLDLLAKFDAEKVDLAFPTQTLHIALLPHAAQISQRATERPRMQLDN